MTLLRTHLRLFVSECATPWSPYQRQSKHPTVSPTHPSPRVASQAHVHRAWRLQRCSCSVRGTQSSMPRTRTSRTTPGYPPSLHCRPARASVPLRLFPPSRPALAMKIDARSVRLESHRQNVSRRLQEALLGVLHHLVQHCTACHRCSRRPHEPSARPWASPTRHAKVPEQTDRTAQ